MSYSRQIKTLHNSLYDRFNGGSWRGWLNVCQESASKAKNHERAYYIGELIRFDIQQPGPHTDEELNELINENQ